MSTKINLDGKRQITITFSDPLPDSCVSPEFISEFQKLIRGWVDDDATKTVILANPQTDNLATVDGNQVLVPAAKSWTESQLKSSGANVEVTFDGFAGEGIDPTSERCMIWVRIGDSSDAFAYKTITASEIVISIPTLSADETVEIRLIEVPQPGGTA